MRLPFKFTSIILCLILALGLPTDNFHTSAKGGFPQNYQVLLKDLNKKYPNWQFVPDFVPLTFTQAVTMQDDLFVKITDENYNSWRSMRKGCYDWSKEKFVPSNEGYYYGASREVIAYYLDPRNFLNENDIYIFLNHYFENSSLTIGDIEDFVNGTFLDDTIKDKKDEYYGKSFSEVIYDVSKLINVNPLIIATTILNENGNNGSKLTDGFKLKNTNVYNFFNYSSVGNTYNEVLLNSANFAYSQGWTTRSKSIVYGAYKFFNDYTHLKNTTYYYMNFNVFDIDGRVLQYSQDIKDAFGSSQVLKEFYKNKTNAKLVFNIPIFVSMPSTAATKPAKTDKLNNYYLNHMEAYMLTPSFNRYNYEYSMVARGAERVYVDLPRGATLSGSNVFKLTKGNNSVSITVRAQTGYTQQYKLNIYSYKNGTLTVIVGTNNKTIFGDTDSNGHITLIDLANIRLHLLKLYTLKGGSFISADTDCDGKITTNDLENVRLHLLNVLSLN